MPTVAQQNMLTLLELARNIDPQGNLIKVAEILTKTNYIWDDIPWFEANDIFSHVHAQEFSEPSGEWRVLNDGVGLASPTTEQVRDVLAMLEQYSESDVALTNAAPNPMQFRNNRARRILRGMASTFITGLFYGNNGTDSGTFNGLAVRLDALTNNVISCSGTGSDLTSAYVVQWGEGKVWGGYPRGAQIGLQHRDLGEVTAQTTSGKQFQAFRDHFKIHGGLVVEDYRCIGRVCNIETTGTTNTFDEDALIECMNNMDNDWAGAGIYVNKTVMTQMEIRVKDKSNITYAYADGLAPGPVLTFKGVPVRLCENILNTESAVS